MNPELSQLEPFLRRNILGQDHIIPVVSSLIRQACLDLPHPGELKCGLLFLGPTGVGKTETCKKIAEFLFGKEAFHKLDMSEFSNEKDALSNFIGDNSGSLGRLGKILSILGPKFLLFDEIEKAHFSIVDVFLQILDEARVTVANSKTFDLSDCYVVLTSNVGADAIMRSKKPSISRIEAHVISAFARKFRPELMHRFQGRIIFNKLSHDIQLLIAKKEIDDELAKLALKNIHLSYSQDVVHFLYSIGFDKLYGARPLKNAVRYHIRHAIEQAILSSSMGNSLSISPCGSKLVVI